MSDADAAAAEDADGAAAADTVDSKLPILCACAAVGVSSWNSANAAVLRGRGFIYMCDAVLAAFPPGTSALITASFICSYIHQHAHSFRIAALSSIASVVPITLSHPV